MSTTSTRPAPVTMRDALINALQAAAEYNPGDVEAPLAIVWPDADREWETVVRQLEATIPVLRLGDYDQVSWTGPAAFLRLAVSSQSAENRTLPPVVYLPGISRRRLTDVESLADALKPLAALIVRSSFFAQRNSNDWTLYAFLTNTAQGLGLDVAADARTKSALSRAIPRMLDHEMSDLRGRRLDADALNALVVDDPIRTILQWLDDPERFEEDARRDDVWSGFVDLVSGKYKVDPEKDGPLAAGAKLGDRQGPWAQVWSRFAQSPAAYPGLPATLRKAKPDDLIPLHPDSWPQLNADAEADVFSALSTLPGRSAPEIRASVTRLMQAHRARLQTVWAQLGQTPGALAVTSLGALAELTETLATGSTVAELATEYAATGWKVDDAFIRVLQSLEPGHARLPDVVKAGESLYRPWLEATVATFRGAWDGSTGDSERPTVSTEPAGTCLVFVDGLRLDVAQSLAEVVETRGLEVELQWRLAGVPTVTSTCKPSVSPVASAFGSGEGLAPKTTDGAGYSQDQLKRALDDAGWQFIPPGTDGDPAGLGWTEAGDIDSMGHDLGDRIAAHLPGQVGALARRAAELLAAGWTRVVFITDHGWLLLPSKLPKHHLPEHLTVIRKGRCARLREGVAVPEGISTLPWSWDRHADIVVAPGIHAFEEGKVYEHGGISPQESVVPYLAVSAPSTTSVAASGGVDLSWVGMTLRVECDWVPEGARVDIRRHAADSSTSLVSRPKEFKGGRARLMADDQHAGEAAYVVVVDLADRLLAQNATSIPED
ncbi:BREX-1 system phosphatase PglZ type B [Terrabacter carboxydivorans]|uniref:BREX-1 system phosphatase PglZ type B n=1 Tax=Terrabacter carboxydivorans TaxID=619730 RepID=A0ABP5Y4D8_9MICO